MTVVISYRTACHFPRCRRWTVGVLLLTMLIHSGCVALSPERSEARADNKEVASLYREDQGARVALGTNVALWSNLSGSDLERRMRVKALYAAGQLHTGSDFYCAAMVLQHGVTSDDYLLAHEFSIIALAKGEPRAKWLAAATEDRFLMQIKRPQRFGTQFYMKPDQQWELYTTADSVTNQLRAQLGVPPLAEAKEKQTRLNLKHTADKTKPEADEELTPNRTPLVVDEAKPAAGPPGGGELIDEAIVGSWQGLTPNGAPVEFEFMPDHRVTWQSYLGTVHGRYDLAPAGDLFEIDLYSFDHPQLRGERLVAIARVESGKLFFEAASMKEAEAQSIPLRRPKSFGEEVMQLICKK